MDSLRSVECQVMYTPSSNPTTLTKPELCLHILHGPVKKIECFAEPPVVKCTIRFFFHEKKNIAGVVEGEREHDRE